MLNLKNKIIKELEVKLLENNVEMNEGAIQNKMTPSFASLFKIQDNKTVSQLKSEIINTVNVYNRQKKERENYIIIFGLKDVKKITLVFR
jgi:hypothetical protein